MNRIILWILIIAALSGLAYFVLKDEKTFSFVFGNDSLKSLKDSAGNFLEQGATGLSEVLNKGKSLANKTIQGATEKIKEKTKEKTFEIVQEGLKSAEDAAENILGVNSGQSLNQNSSSDFFAYLIKINTPLSFIIKNPFSLADAKNINYQIDWGDGQKDSGELKAEQNITVAHSWNKEGEYLVQFSAEGGSAAGGKIATIESKKADYQIKILVVK